MPTADEFDIDEAAAMPFGPSAGPEILRQFDAGPWRRECTDAGIDLRIAAVMLEKTKDELTDLARGLGQATVHDELERLLARQKRFSELAEMLQSAAGRLIIAGAAVCREGRPRPVEGFGPIL